MASERSRNCSTEMSQGISRVRIIPNPRLLCRFLPRGCEVLLNSVGFAQGFPVTDVLFRHFFSAIVPFCYGVFLLCTGFCAFMIIDIVKDPCSAWLCLLVLVVWLSGGAQILGNPPSTIFTIFPWVMDLVLKLNSDPCKRKLHALALRAAPFAAARLPDPCLLWTLLTRALRGRNAARPGY